MSAGQWMATLEAAVHSGRRSPSTGDPDVLVGASRHRRRPVPSRLQRERAVSAEVRKQLFEGREPFLASLYLGLPSVGLVIAAFLDRERRRACWLLAAAAAFALLVSLGRHRRSTTCWSPRCRR